MLATPATLQRTYSIRENVCKKLRICCAPHLVLSRPVGREIRFLKLERLPAEGDCTFLQHYCLHTLHSLAWDQPSPATATNHNCTLAKVARCWHLLPAPLHSTALHCTSLRRYISPPPLHPSEPPPLVTESPPQYARVSRRQQAAQAAPGVSSLFYPVASKSQTPSIFLAWGAQPSESPQKSVKLHWRLCSDNMLLHRTPRPSCFCTAYPFVDVLCHILWGYLL